MSLISLVLAIMLITACVRCMGRVPRCRRLLMAYAYGHFGFIVLSVSVYTWQVFEFGGIGRYGRGQTLLLIGSQLARSLAGVSFPLLLAVLLPRPEVRRLFEGE